MKRIKFDVELVKRVLYSMLFISAFTTLLDLYVPIKMMISGDKMLFNEILSHIQYRHHFPFILLASIIVGLFSGQQMEGNSKKQE